MTELKFVNILKHDVKREYGTSSTLRARANNTLHMDEELREIFRFKDTKISNWIVEVTSYISQSYDIKRNLLFSYRNIYRKVFAEQSTCTVRQIYRK